jgi:hypothetical protein
VSKQPRLAEAGDDAVALRKIGRDYLQMVAQSCGEEYNGGWAWSSFGLWVPAEDPVAAFDEMQRIFGDCSPDDPATVEILWKSRYDAEPAWYRMHVMETFPDRLRPAMRGFWANPASGLVELDDVAAVRPSVEGLPLSCTETGSPTFRPSFLRPAAEPEELLPEVTMTPAEAQLMIDHYLHYESHRLGTLWPTIHVQAASTGDRLLSIVTAAGAEGSRTDVNITVAVRDTSVSQCRQHVYDPAPAYTHGDETRTVGLHEVAHAHKDGTVGLEEYGREHLEVVLTCMALYGGSLHLATVALDGAAVPLATETLYRVNYDWRCELIEDPEQRQIRVTNDAIAWFEGKWWSRPRA